MDAVLETWKVDGHAALSARKVSLLAGAPVSSIYHHFGSLEHLFSRAQQAALERARCWCDAQLHLVSMVGGDMAAFPGFFATVVDEWANSQRQLAFAWREGQLLGARSAAHRQVSEGWTALWADFWQAAGEQFGLGSKRIVVERVFENESLLHMLRWERMLDRAGLDEFSRGLAAWLTGSKMPPAPWREAARSEAQRTMPELPQRDGTAVAVMEAATLVLEQQGVAGLTHRAVAAQAGLTLGVVLHKFRTKSELLAAAFEGVYLSNLGRAARETEAAQASGGDLSMLDLLARGIHRSVGKVGMEELTLAAARDPALQQFASQMRYLRGRSARGALEQIAGGKRRIGHLEAALFSSFASAQIRVHTGADHELAQRSIREELEVVSACVRNVESAEEDG